MERQDFTNGLQVAGIYQKCLTLRWKEIRWCLEKRNPENSYPKAKWKDYGYLLNRISSWSSIQRVKRLEIKSELKRVRCFSVAMARGLHLFDAQTIATLENLL